MSSMAKGSTSLADPKLLDKIDKLFELNIGDHVALPQLLVVGDQSSGKSSVLEGLTGLAFPRDSQLCTRFVTQITFRRSQSVRKCVSIIPAAGSDRGHVDTLRAWRREDKDILDKAMFISILQEVTQVMGIDQSSAKSAGKKTFSEDVMKIEIDGPTEQHLSVIDIPGIFKKTAPGITTIADIEMIRNMNLSFMSNERSVILAVIPANVDIATQEILEMAATCDSAGNRTLGVFTKPDLIDKGAEGSVLNILQGTTHNLNLGWCIVRNPGQKDLDNPAHDRQSMEKLFFQTQDPWKKVDKEKAGVEALKLRLVDVLGEMVTREFPAVKREISRLHKEKTTSLSKLGPSRETRDQQYEFLLDVANKFQIKVTNALKAEYSDEDIFENSPALRLATRVVERNSEFSSDMARLGHTHAFHDGPVDTKGTTSLHSNASTGFTNAPQVTFGQGTIHPTPFSFGQPALAKSSQQPHQATRPPSNGSSAGNIAQKESRMVGTHSEELWDIVSASQLVAAPHEKIIDSWLTSVYKNTRGFGLGGFDPSVLTVIWKQQSIKWEVLTMGYISDIVSLVHTFIVSLVHTFIVKLLSRLCYDPRLEAAIMSQILDQLQEKYRQGIGMATFNLDVERNGTPLTTNDYFTQNLDASRQKRIKTGLEKDAFVRDDGSKWARIDAHVRTTAAGNTEYSVQELHDLLQSYYKVVRKRFVDNVCKQAADNYLVSGTDTPLTVFSPSFVSKLSDDQLDAIAGEDTSTRRRRAQLRADIQLLEKGRRVLL